MSTRAHTLRAVLPRDGAADDLGPRASVAGPTIDEDELVRAARDRLDLVGLRAVAPDEGACGHLHPGERLLALEHATLLADEGAGPSPGRVGAFGRVYITNERLVHVPCDGASPVALPLEDVDDAAVTTGRLLLVLRDGGGVALETPWPRLLRLEVGRAREQRATTLRGARGRGDGGPCPGGGTL